MINKIFKNLFWDDERNKYFIIHRNNKRELPNMETILSAYIVELLNKLTGGENDT